MPATWVPWPPWADVFVHRIAGFPQHVVAVGPGRAAADPARVRPDVGGQVRVGVVHARIGLADHDRASSGACSPRLQRAVVGSGRAGAGRPEHFFDALGGDRLSGVARSPLQLERGIVRRRARLHQVVRLRVGHGASVPQPAHDSHHPARGNPELAGRDEVLTGDPSAAGRPDGRAELTVAPAACRALDRMALRRRDPGAEAHEDHPRTERVGRARAERDGRARAQRRGCDDEQRRDHVAYRRFALRPCPPRSRSMPIAPRSRLSAVMRRRPQAWTAPTSA